MQQCLLQRLHDTPEASQLSQPLEGSWPHGTDGFEGVDGEAGDGSGAGKDVKGRSEVREEDPRQGMVTEEEAGYREETQAVMVQLVAQNALLQDKVEALDAHLHALAGVGAAPREGMDGGGDTRASSTVTLSLQVQRLLEVSLCV